MKKVLSLILSLALVLSVSSVAMAAGGTMSGTGTEADPFLIADAADLAAFREAVNGGNDYSGKYVKLADNITLSGEWTPIGTGTRSGRNFSGQAFRGTFDGGNNTISNLAISNGDSSSVIGLFGGVDGGTVKNLTLSDVSINAASNKNAGAAIGLMVNGATADNITVSGSVSAADGVGGIVGRMIASGVISNCTNYATVSSGETAGGIVGKAYYTEVGKDMTISCCINNGVITSGYSAGGIAGLSAANVIDCKNTAAIKGAVEAGGIVGEQTMYGTVSGNTNSGTISNDVTGGTAYGGIIGWLRYANNTTDYPLYDTIVVSNNTNNGNIAAEGASLGSGGIVGSVYNQAFVTGNTNNADSIIGGTFASGIVGGAQQAAGNVEISEETIVAYNNVSTTDVNEIEANCVASDMYNNAPNTFEAEDNSDAWVAEIDGKKFATTNAAINEAENGDTITLLVDNVDTSKFNKGKNLTIVDSKGNTSTIKDGIMVSPASLDFGTMEVGYEQPDAKEVKVTYFGFKDIAVKVDSDSYDISEVIETEDNIYTFTVQPKVGLPIGNYTATLNVTEEEPPVASESPDPSAAVASHALSAAAVEPGAVINVNFVVTEIKTDDPIEDDPIEDDPIEDDPIEDDKPASSGTGIKVQYMGGNSFSTTNSDVPIAVEIDGVPVSFTGNGKYFTVGCIQPGAKWVTVRWQGTSVTTNFTPDVTVVCTQVGLPKTGDVSVMAYALMAVIAAAGAMLKK